jgi:hypothetical protein
MAGICSRRETEHRTKMPVHGERINADSYALARCDSRRFSPEVFSFQAVIELIAVFQGAFRTFERAIRLLS